jgi:hypothetical protein
MAIAAALMIMASTDLVRAAESTSAADHGPTLRSAHANVRAAVRSYRVSIAAVAAGSSRRCNTIACPGDVIVGIAYWSMACSCAPDRKS